MCLDFVQNWSGERMDYEGHPLLPVRACAHGHVEAGFLRTVGYALNHLPGGKRRTRTYVLYSYGPFNV